MRTSLIFILAAITVSCVNKDKDLETVYQFDFDPKSRDKKKELAYQQNLWLNPDTVAVEYGVPPMTRYDSLFHLELDTATLRGKRDQIMLDFLLLNSPSGPDYDSLFDLNYDGYVDYVIGFYYQSGTGLKHGIKVYLFDSQNKVYQKDSLLSSLANPSFYLEEKIITGFYLPHGAGGGEKLEWIHDKWIITKTVSGSSAEEFTDSIYWYISYPQTGRKDSVLDFYSGIPRQDILRNDYGVN
jgi:hypothetical protein